jgi:redox-sensitive bicupin YhaK (pirin superfamily)
MDFGNFYFQFSRLSIPLGPKQGHSPEHHDDRTQTLQSTCRRGSWLAEGAAPLFLRRIRGPNPNGLGRLARNDDEIASNSGFPPHPHANMEIITYVREGAITHKDSLGNEGRTEAGDVQVMSAGSGIRHAEYNVEPGPTRIFQIWIVPTRRGGSPAWGSQPFPKGDRSGRFVTLASGFDEDGDALPIRADARVLGATLRAGESVDYALGVERRGYLVPATGMVEVNGTRIEARDGAAINDAAVVKVTAIEDSELVLVDTR